MRSAFGGGEGAVWALIVGSWEKNENIARQHRMGKDTVQRGVGEAN